MDLRQFGYVIKGNFQRRKNTHLLSALFVGLTTITAGTLIVRYEIRRARTQVENLIQEDRATLEWLKSYPPTNTLENLSSKITK